MFQYDVLVLLGGGINDVHVAYDAVWLGTENGRLLKCPITITEDNLECYEFDQIEWFRFRIPPSIPVIYNIGSRNDGYLYASLSGSGRDDM